ncbi:MAG: hypothetical protein ABSC23_16360 [Bryobacteraceae bacterium]
MESQRYSLPKGGRRWLALVIGIYVISLLVTRPDTYIDSFNYATNIVDQRMGTADPARDPFWDFGHALWRPMGYLLYICIGGPLTGMFDGNQTFAAATSLIVWSIAGALVAAVFLYLLVARLSGSAWAAGLATIGFVSTHAVMNFKLTGCAYSAGIGCQAAGFYYLYTALQERRTRLPRALAAGVFLGLSVSIWFPFVLPLPGYLCFALLWRDETTEPRLGARVRLLAGASIAAAAVVAAVYLPVMAFRGIRTVEQFRQWMEASRYGIQPTRGFARMLFSIPRGFLLLKTDNGILKRVLLHDPGDRPPMADILSAAWKPVAVYVVLTVLALRLRSSDWGRRMLAFLGAAAIPLLIFAAFLFDPSPPERYLGIFPLLFTSIGLVFARQPLARASRIVFFLFIGAMMAANSWAMWRFRPETGEAGTIARLESVNRQASKNDLILVPSWLDDGLRFVDSQPFHRASRFRLNLQPGVALGSVHSTHWRPPVSEAILATWQRGGRVWISRRLIQEKPAPAWWIENDESRVRWADVSGFYRAFDTANPVGSEDGFLELERSPRNETLLQQATGQR